MLVNHADADVDRLGRRPEADLPAIEQNSPRVRLQQTKRDAHERRFPRSILTEYRVDGSRSNGQFGSIERSRRPEALYDSLQLQRGRARGLRAHSPDGASMKRDSMPNSPAIRSPRARTPRVSVA